ncbi:cation diffusion facilitator family transporter [Eilatimonas milleporae]|uniref:Protein p34 n=1 Tax=Eilatimonas milleporae TaxID=911205 RepID=A0A3M0CC73_9PROT|nr:cation diffusion facilitator family transporter [Eilatimonas milleporae]RMB04619.1 ferrous-iron efflux pump FieF [Eilatimonas milleporae]
MAREADDRLVRLATAASVGVALSLLSAKAAVWWLSGSVSMLGSVADSGLDLAASLVTLFAVRAAIRPADRTHRFGHGKAEALAALFQATLMTGSALFLLLEAVRHLMAPEPIVRSALVLAVSATAIALTLGLVSFQNHVVAKTRSLAIKGDALHYKGDLALNLGVIAAALASTAGLATADGLAGLGITAYILRGAWRAGRPAIDQIMDRELPDDERERIFNLVMGNRDVAGLHKLRTRAAGRDRFIEMHIEVDGGLSLDAAHLIAEEIEATLSEAFPGADVIIHVDPLRAQSDILTARELDMRKDKGPC